MAEMIQQLTVEQLAAALDAGEQFTVVDTRPADSYEAFHVPGAVSVPFHPADGLSEEQWDRVDDIAARGRVVAICGKGLTSTAFGFELDARGYDDVAVVKGGMEDWSKLYEVVEVETDSDDLFVAQVQRRAKGCLGYVVGSESAGEAVVVDPTRQHHEFELVAADRGLRVVGVLDTHVHADHVSGGRALADRLDVPYYLGSHADDRGVEYEYEPLEDGDAVPVGDVDVTALYAPGHTSEMVNYRVGDEALLTGDTLFVESVGRTELQFGDEDAATGAELLYDTLHERLLDLPDATRVLPGHVSVSADGEYGVAGPGDLVSARLGTLRAELDLLQLDREAFVARLTDETPEKPPNYETVIDVNAGREPMPDDETATELELGPNNCAA
jgi:glyoxylase-like metal-dependent hydrolase (beta-lactamase superfamily II)/rhodanese-related sulfurtransferase